jgi:enediyne biosynthesis protein E4
MSRERALRIGLAVVFAGLLAAPLLHKHLNASPAGAAQGQAAALERYGFVLQEVARASGIEFTHRAPTLDAKLAHIMPQVASMGAAVSVVDVDRDGWPDLYVTNSAEGSRNALYRNLGDGRFRDVAGELGIADVNAPGTGVSMAAVWGDYDNDGFEDLFLVKWGRPELFHNDAGRGFTRVGEAAGLPKWLNANTALWFDYDGDGLLDLFVAGYYPEHIDLWHLDSTKVMPDSFEYATNGGRKFLFHNLGGGRFEEVALKLGLTSKRWTLAAAAADLRGNGRQDLFVANDYGVSELFLNDGQGFSEVGKQTGIGFAPKSGMNASFGDVLNEGRFAIYVSNISEDGILIQGNNLWVPREGVNAPLRYQNLARELGVELGGWSFGAQFGDLNNDGALDLYLTNGYISADKDRSYWYDFSKVAGGASVIIGDAKNWPAFAGRSLSGYQPKRVWLNDGAGKFFDVAPMVGVTDKLDGRAVALADLWNRGVLDVIVANQGGPLLLYKNSVAPAREWIAFQLEGTRSNRSALGARITLHWNGQRQVQTVSGGSGFAAQNDRRLHFGLGAAPRIEKAEIVWPSGQRQTLPAPQSGKLHQVKEPA